MPLKNVNTKATDGGGGKRTASQTPKATTPKTSTPRATVPKPNAPVYGSQYGGASTRNNTNNNTYGSNYGGVASNKNNAPRKPKVDTQSAGNKNNQTQKSVSVKDKIQDWINDTAKYYNNSTYTGGQIGNSLNFNPTADNETAKATTGETAKETANRRTAEDLLKGDGTTKGHTLTERIESLFTGGYDINKEQKPKNDFSLSVSIGGLDAFDKANYEKILAKTDKEDAKRGIDNLPTITIDKTTGQEADAERVESLAKSVEDKRNELNSRSNQAKLDLQNGVISNDDYLVTSDQINAETNENEARAKELENYQTLSPREYYDWLKQNGTKEDIKKFEAYVGSFNDSILESLWNQYQATLVDFMARPFQAYDMVKQYVDASNLETELVGFDDAGQPIYETKNNAFNVKGDETSFDARDKNNISTKMQDYANELRSYTLNGVNDQGLRNYSLQTVGSLMPMINDAIVGQITGTIVGITEAEALTNFASGLTNIEMGIGSANETFRKRLDEGNTVGTSFYNGVAHGVVTGAIEALNVGNIASITNLFTGAGTFVLGDGMFSLPKLEEMGRRSHMNGKGEAFEEIAEYGVDNIVDLLTSAITGEEVSREKSIFNSEAWGAIGEGGLTDQAIMAYAGSYLLELPGNINTYVDSYAKFKASGEAKTYWQNAGNYFRSQNDIANAEKCDGIVKFIDRERQTYIDNSAIKDAVETEADQVAPAPSIEEAMNIVANAFKLDVDENFQNYENSVNQITSLRNEIENSLNERNIALDSLDTFMALDPAERTKFFENARKIDEAFPNAGVMYSASIPENAFVIKQINEKPTIVVNPNGETASVVSALHEVVHTIEGTKEYQELFDTVFPTVEDFKNKFNELSADRYSGDDFGTIRKEALTVALTEDILGEEGSQKFVDHMAKYNTSTAYKLWYKLKEATGLLRDNSTLGRLTNLMTNALANQNEVFMEDGFAFDKRATTRKQTQQLFEEIENGTKKAPDYGKGIPLVRTVTDENGNLVVYPPKWARDMGLRNFPHLMQEDTVSNTQYDPNDPSTNRFKSTRHHLHNAIDKDVVNNLDILYENPFAVFESPSKAGEYILALKATDSKGYPLLISMNPPMKKGGSYVTVDFADYDSLFKKNVANMATGFYSKDHAYKGQVSNYFKGLNMLWSEGNKTKNEVLRSIDSLQRTASGNTLIDSSIASLFRKARQLEMLESNAPKNVPEQWNEELLRRDIKTFEQATKNEERNVTAPDFTPEDITDAIDNGFVKVYGTSPIKVGEIVSPSRSEAEGILQANIENGLNKPGDKLYEKTVWLDNVAWYDTLTGQYAPVDPEVGSKYYASVAPYLDTQLTEGNRKKLLSIAEKTYTDTANMIANALGLQYAGRVENVGGYENEQGKKIRELSWTHTLDTDPRNAKLFASLMGDLAFENQEAVIAYTNLQDIDPNEVIIGANGKDGGTYGVDHAIRFNNLEEIKKSLQKADIANYSIDRENKILHVQDFGFEKDLVNKIGNLLSDVAEGGNYEGSEARGIYSYYLTRVSRQALYEQGLKGETDERGWEDKSHLSGQARELIKEANRKVTDVLDKANNGQESPFLRKSIPEDIKVQLSSGGLKAVERLFASKNDALHERGARLIESNVEARNMEADGATPEEIWNKTGWIKKSDGKWRFQFYDGAVETLNRIADLLNGASGKTMSYFHDNVPKITDLLGEDNPIFEMYPELKNIYISFSSTGDEVLGGYRKGETDWDGDFEVYPSIDFNLRSYYKDKVDEDGVVVPNQYEFNFTEKEIEDISNTFFHELQHAIQEIEGFEGGSNLNLAGRDIVYERVEKAKRDKEESEKALLDSGLYIDTIDRARDRMNTYGEAPPGFTDAQKADLKRYTDATNYLSLRYRNVNYNDALERYKNTLGEIEAREEAWRATDPAIREVTPNPDGHIKSQALKDKYGINKIQYSKRTQNGVPRSEKYANWDESRKKITLAKALQFSTENKSVQELVDMAERIRQYVIADDVERVRNAELYTLDAISESTEKALEKLDEIAKAIPKTCNDNSPQRARYRGQLVSRMANKVFKDVPKERRAWVVLGPSASGKSSFINKYLNANGGVIDSDEFKFATKEFKQYGGIMSDALHEESDRLAKRLKEYGISEGYNLTFPLVGRNEQKIMNLVRELQSKGYRVIVSGTDLPPEKAQYRALNRFIEDDRYLRLDYMRRIDDSPKKTYDAVRKMEGVEDGGLWNTDVEFGKPFERIEVGSNNQGHDGQLGNRNENGSELARSGNGRGRDLRNTTDGEVNGLNGSFSDGGVPVRPTAEVVDGYGERRNQRFATSNLQKSPVLNNKQKAQVRKEVAEGKFTYMGLINKVEVQRAREYMERDGVDATYDKFMAVNRPDAKSVIQGEILLQKLAQDNDPRWESVASKLADDATYAGQFLQAYAIMQRLTPDGQLATIRRNMNRMQRELDELLGNKSPRLEIGEELERELRNAQTTEEQETVREKIRKHLTDQVPKRFRDVINSWRYLAMLGNPRTHIRNFVGNAVNIPAVTLKNIIGTALESVVADKLKYRTKAVLNRFDEVDQARLELGREQFDLNRNAIDKALGQKYERKGFSDKNAFGRILNKLSDWNSDALDAEDRLFSRARYASSYAQFLKANDLTAENLTPEMQKMANEYALIESERATYRDANAVADWLNELSTSKKKGLRMASYVKDAILPFTKTPMNIVKRGVRYSPVGLLYTIAYDSKQLADGKITANDYIDNLSQGLTGAGIALMGAFLRSLGLFRTKDDDKDRKQYFDSENGEQDYAIDLSPFGLNGTYTVDWASPVIMPFAIGAELYDAFSGFEGVNGFDGAINAVADVSAKVMDPIMETSMLSSLQDALKSYSTSGGEWLGEMVLSMASSYIQQMIPTIGGQIARTIDDTRRTTYTDKGKVDKTIKQIMNKIPWLSKLNEPYINRQGQEEKTEGNTWWKRAFLNMVSPGYYSSKDVDKYDEELYRLYESTASLDAFPSSGSKSITYEKENMKFSPKEYTEWHKTRWQTETRYVNEFIDSNTYKNLTDEERVKTIKSIRDYAQKVAKKQFLESKGYKFTDDKELAERDDRYIYDKELTNIKGAQDNGINIYEYFGYMDDAGSKQADKVSYLEDSDLNQEQKEYLYGLSGYKTSYDEAYAKAFGTQKGGSKSKSTSSKTHKSSSKSGGSSGRNVSHGRGRVSMASSTAVSTPKQARATNNNYLNAYSTSFGRGKNVSTGSNSQVVCPRCGNRVSNNTGRCPVCGARL